MQVSIPLRRVRWATRLLVALAMGASLVGCGTTSGTEAGDDGSEPDPSADIHSTAPIAVERLAARLRLRARPADRAGRVYIESADGDRILLVRGSRSISVRGTPYAATSDVEARDGTVFVSAADARAIERLWRKSIPTGGAVAGEGQQRAALELPPPLPPAPPSPPTPPPVARVGGTVVLDAGHGGKDPGAPGRSGIPEKNVVLDVARRVAVRLRAAGTRVVFTRDSDIFIELDERAAIGNRTAPTLFVSVHADSAENVSAEGFSVYVNRDGGPAKARSEVAARGILKEMRVTGARDRGLKRAGYRVLKKAHGAAVLVEMGFLSNYGESSRLARPEYRQRMADAIANGILRFLRGR